jgi:hypothetical protein
VTETLRKIMIEQFKNTFIEILRSQFRAHPELSVKFLSESSARQKDIDKEIVRVSEEMSRTLVSKLAEKGYLERDAPDAELNRLISEVLKEFGAQNE